MVDLPTSPITEMRLRNLRRFEDTGDLKLSAINFIFGKNSSGKTTLLRAPLLLKQLVNERSLAGGVPFAGPYVDFGSYPEAVHNSERSRDIHLSFEVDFPPAARRIPRGLLEHLRPFEKIRFEVTLHWNATKGQAQFNRILIIDHRRTRRIADLKRLGPDRIRVEIPPASLNRTVQGASELTFATLSSLPLELDYSERGGTPIAELLLYTMWNVLSSAVRKIVHIGPLRDMPERAYRIDQLSTSSGSTEHVVGMLVSHTDAVAPVSRALKSLGIAKQVEIVQPAPGYAGVFLSDLDSNRRDNLADVGFGASQVLPILVRLALAPRDSLILVEQPELHLHPEVQGQLAEVMIDLALARGFSILVESHSENMLLRLRRLVASGSLDPSAVRIFVSDKGAVRAAEIDSKGRLDMSAFPAGFFEEEWEEAMGIMQGGANRA
ncbi:AAA family ATPase [Micromonospora chalcea]